ncbi:MAG: diguanylate cyclase [Candidatus Eremiobacteraeota bacterium]|nr:diguanylate cyclase [Candidatus Eremiobacteraeota bacterium]
MVTPLIVLVFTGGMIVALGLVNGLLGITLRDRAYLWYAAAMLAFVAFDAVSASARLGAAHEPAVQGAYLLYCGAIAVFGAAFLDLPRAAPAAWRAVLMCYGALVLTGIAYAAVPTALRRGHLDGSLEPLATTAFLIAVFAAGLVAWRNGNPLARTACIAFAGVVIGLVTWACGTYGVVPRSALTDAAGGLGVAWEAIFLSVALAERIRGLEAVAFRDALTGVANRRAFDLRFADEWRRATRTRTRLAVVLLDVDRFKAYNDACGHPRGDRVLARVAQALAHAALRPEDFVARYGGEEFVVVLPGCGRADAARLANAALAAIRALAIAHPAHEPGIVTASAGVASLVPRHGLRPRALLVAADRALYEAKRDGRDRVATRPPRAAG